MHHCTHRWSSCLSCCAVNSPGCNQRHGCFTYGENTILGLQVRCIPVLQRALPRHLTPAASNNTSPSWGWTQSSRLSPYHVITQARQVCSCLLCLTYGMWILPRPAGGIGWPRRWSGRTAATGTATHSTAAASGRGTSGILPADEDLGAVCPGLQGQSAELAPRSYQQACVLWMFCAACILVRHGNMGAVTVAFTRTWVKRGAKLA